jgi:hypothetical protein
MRGFRTGINTRRRTRPSVGRHLMSTSDRIALAVLIVVLDVAVFVIPVTGLVAAWVLLARPPWFREWVERLYASRP